MRDGQRLCPSAQPGMTEGAIFGVVGGTLQAPRVTYFPACLPVTGPTPARDGMPKMTEIFRFSAPCAGPLCSHFDSSSCRLAARVVLHLRPVVDRLPACALRPQCRWWQQEGRAACLRCPQVVTEVRHPSAELREIAGPDDPSAGRATAAAPAPDQTR